MILMLVLSLCSVFMFDLYWVIPCIFLACGISLTALGIVGEYIGKIYKEVKHRPRYIIETVEINND